jgi:hypothetical protein
MYDVYGTLCGTYEEACIVAGVDTPAQIEQELFWDTVNFEIENLMNPVRCVPCYYAAQAGGEANDDPFPF